MNWLSRTISNFKQRIQRLPRLLRPVAVTILGLILSFAGGLFGSAISFVPGLSTAVVVLSVVGGITSIVGGAFYLVYLVVEWILQRLNFDDVHPLIGMVFLASVCTTAAGLRPYNPVVVCTGLFIAIVSILASPGRLQSKIVPAPLRKIDDLFERFRIYYRSLSRTKGPDRVLRFGRLAQITTIAGPALGVILVLAGVILDAFLLVAIGTAMVLVGGFTLLPFLITTLGYSLYVRLRGEVLMRRHPEIIAGLARLSPPENDPGRKSLYARARRLLMEIQNDSTGSKLIPSLGDDNDARVAELMLKNLDQGELVNAFNNALQAKPDAIETLRRLFRPEVGDAFINALGSKRPTTSANAALVLAELGITRALPELRWKASAVAESSDSVRDACSAAVEKLEALTALPRAVESSRRYSDSLPRSTDEDVPLPERLPRQTNS